MTIITACGSKKNAALIHGICDELKTRGFVVLPPPLHDLSFTQNLNAEQSLLVWKGATFAHLNRITKCDICIMVNPGGYLGNSSTLEMGYAAAHGKLIIALRHDTELSRESLFDIVLDTENVSEIVEKIVTLSASV